MIKKSTYIRKFSVTQRRQIETIMQEHGIKTVAKALLFAADQYQDHKNEIARLKRFLAMKDKKIEKLQNPPV